MAEQSLQAHPVSNMTYAQCRAVEKMDMVLGNGKWVLRIGNCEPELLRYELHFNMLQRVHHLLNRPGRQRHSQLANAGLRNANCGAEDP